MSMPKMRSSRCSICFRCPPPRKVSRVPARNGAGADWSAEAYWGRATARQWQSETEAALSDFDKAVEPDGDVGDALYVAYAYSLFDAGDVAKALQPIGEALKRGLDDELILKELAENLEGEDLQRYLQILDAYGIAYAGGMSLGEMTIDQINAPTDRDQAKG